MQDVSDDSDAAGEAQRRLTGHELATGRDARACATVCGRLTGALEAEFAAAAQAGAAVACVAGCSFCCHQRVSVFPHEAIALLEYLRTSCSAATSAAVEERVLENARKVDGMTAREHRSASLACAFLLDGRCSAYAARPSACAAYHSMSRERCEYSYNHPRDIGTPSNHRPALLRLQALGDALIAATRAGLTDAGLSSAKGELHQLVRTLIENAGVAERWLAGGDLGAAPADRSAAGDCAPRDAAQQ